MEENKETLKSLGFTSHTTTCHQASVFQKRALSKTHLALFLIVIYFHTIYHYLFYRIKKQSELKLFSMKHSFIRTVLAAQGIPC